MIRKLIKLEVDHIAAVDFPANKRRFLIIKNEKQEPVANVTGKSDQEVFTDYVQAVAQARNVSLDEIFREQPDLYSWYRQLATS